MNMASVNIPAHSSRSSLEHGTDLSPAWAIALKSKTSSIENTVRVNKSSFRLTYTNYFHRPGKFVRLGPKHLSIADPDAVQAIYGHGTGTLKTDFYDSFVSIVPGLFNTRSRSEHTRKRRLVSNIFSSRNVLEFEPHIRSNILLLMKQWDRLCDASLNGLSGDEGEGGWRGRDGWLWLDCLSWLNYLAFDIIGMHNSVKKLLPNCTYISI